MEARKRRYYERHPEKRREHARNRMQAYREREARLVAILRSNLTDDKETPNGGK